MFPTLVAGPTDVQIEVRKFRNPIRQHWGQEDASAHRQEWKKCQKRSFIFTFGSGDLNIQRVLPIILNVSSYTFPLGLQIHFASNWRQSLAAVLGWSAPSKFSKKRADSERTTKMISSSKKANRTKNPIRNIVDNLKLPVGHSKTFLNLGLGDPTIYGNLKCPEVLQMAMKESLKWVSYIEITQIRQINNRETCWCLQETHWLSMLAKGCSCFNCSDLLFHRLHSRWGFPLQNHYPILSRLPNKP